MLGHVIQTEPPVAIPPAPMRAHVRYALPALLLVCHSNGTLYADGEPLPVENAALAYLPAHTPAELAADGGVLTALSFHAELPAALGLSANSPVRAAVCPDGPVCMPADASVCSLYEALRLSAAAEATPPHAIYLLLALLAMLCGAASSAPAVPPVNAHQEELIGKVKRMVAQDLSNKQSLEGIARTLFVNPSYLCSLFKRVTGQTFRQYVTGCRIAEAKRLLTETNELIDDVARAAGFGTTSYFVTVFHAQCGVTPNVFRRQMLRLRTDGQKPLLHSTSKRKED